jgi:DNA-directed RNA polymerase specialized sigma24 family protein
MKKVHDENAADELTVSVFSKVLAKLDLYDENFQFKTWVLTIAQNTVIDYWQKKDGWKVNKKNVAKISFKNSLTQQDPNASTETQTSTETQNAESTQ